MWIDVTWTAWRHKTTQVVLLAGYDGSSSRIIWTYILTFYLAFYMTYILTYTLPCYRAFQLTYIWTFYLTFFLAFYLTFYLAFPWVRMVVVEVRRGTLGVDGRG